MRYEFFSELHFLKIQNKKGHRAETRVASVIGQTLGVYSVNSTHPGVSEIKKIGPAVPGQDNGGDDGARTRDLVRDRHAL
jgi:hypothetical protein